MAIDDGTIHQYSGKSIDDIDGSVVIENEETDPTETIDPPQENRAGDVTMPSTVIEQPSTSTIRLKTTRSARQNVEELTPLKKTKRVLVLDSESDLEDEESEVKRRGNTPGRKRSFAKRKTHKKIKMSEDLKDALKMQLADEIKDKNCPSTASVLQAIGALEKQFPTGDCQPQSQKSQDSHV